MSGECNGKCIYVKWDQVKVTLNKPPLTSNPPGAGKPTNDPETQLKLAVAKWILENEGWAQKCPKPPDPPAPTIFETTCACPDKGDLDFVQVDPPPGKPGTPQAAAAAAGTPVDFDAVWPETTTGVAGSATVNYTAHGTAWLIKREGVGACKPKKVLAKLP